MLTQSFSERRKIFCLLCWWKHKDIKCQSIIVKFVNTYRVNFLWKIHKLISFFTFFLKSFKCYFHSRIYLQFFTKWYHIIPNIICFLSSCSFFMMWKLSQLIKLQRYFLLLLGFPTYKIDCLLACWDEEKQRNEIESMKNLLSSVCEIVSTVFSIEFPKQLFYCIRFIINVTNVHPLTMTKTVLCSENVFLTLQTR